MRKTQILISGLVVVILLGLSALPVKTDAGTKVDVYGKQVLRNTLRAFGITPDGKRLTTAQVNYYANLPDCPTVDYSKAEVIDGEWMSQNEDGSIGVVFNNSNRKGTTIFAITDGN